MEVLYIDYLYNSQFMILLNSKNNLITLYVYNYMNQTKFVYKYNYMNQNKFVYK